MSCAIIGNSSILLEKEWGEIIDSHDCVVRINLAKTENFERFVGSKTTIRFCNLHPLMCRISQDHLREHTKYFPEWDNEYVLSWENQKLFFKDSSFLDYEQNRELKNYILSKNNEIHHLSNDIVHHVRTQLVSEPTMGILSIIYMIEKFGSISCFGFDFYESLDKFHYFEKVVPYSTCHSNLKEKELVHKFADEGKIKIYR